MINYTLTIGGIDYTQYMPYCFSDKEALDESLDMSHIELLYTPLTEPIKPFTEVVLTITQDNLTPITIERYVAIDRMTEIVAHNFTNHDLLLIETTKVTERLFLGGKTVTQPLYHDFTPVNVYAKVSVTTNGSTVEEYKYITSYQTPQVPDEYTILSINDFITAEFSSYTLPITAGTLQILLNGEQVAYTLNPAQALVYDFDENLYTINYVASWVTGDTAVTLGCRFDILYTTQESVSNKTITDAVNDILQTVECLTENETPQFVFGDADLYNDIKSPEFTFSKMSLWEALSQIASYVQAIPYIDGKNNQNQQIIRFFKIDNEQDVSTMLLPYVSQEKTHDIEQFCSSLDANIDNILNSENINETDVGSNETLVEPFEGGYQTLRTESGSVVITEDNCFIETKYPIGRIIKVECGYLKKNDNEQQELVGDITPYIYENTEYGALSSFEETYPYSKSYALKWTYGQRNITGLNFKVPNAVNDVFSNYAIVNIICRKLGKSYTWWNSLWGDIKMYQLQFRVTYLPLIDTRVKQTKPYTEDANNYSIAYNQNANIVDSKAIGENLKGTVARFGNVDKSISYILGKITDIPRIGAKFDDNYYISTISNEFYKDFIICELGLAKNFNRYNQYVGVRNNLRLFEVSERQALDRYIIREDYCTISEEIKTKTNNLPLSIALSNYINNTSSGNGKVTSTWVMTLDEQREEIESAILPVVGLGIGNSTILSFKFEDNYSAGNRATTNEDALTDHSPVKTQKYLPYSDMFGSFKYMQVFFVKGSPTYTALNQGNYINNYNSALTIGDKIPVPDWTAMMDISPAVKNRTSELFKVYKDNREVIHFTYQIHYVTDDKQYVVGSGLGKYNGLLKENFNMANDFKLVTLDKRLNSLSSIIADDDILNEYTFTFGVADTETISFTSTDTWGENASAWAVIHTDENGVNTLIFGKNCDIVKNEEANIQTYLNFTHKIKEN